MHNILVTGATGNVGKELIRWFFSLGLKGNLWAGVRKIEKSQTTFSAFPALQYRTFDFDFPKSWAPAFQGIQTIFLLRPPHISDVKGVFAPLLQEMKNAGVVQVVFLSVQGAEKSGIIPHNKIEKLILKSGLDYVFLRPSYFMQNLTTTLARDIQEKNRILLPAGQALFNWVDVTDIGEMAARVCANFEDNRNQSFEITGLENLTFGRVCQLINQYTGSGIQYRSVNPVRFYQLKKKEGVPQALIMVMIMLHFLPRFQKPPRISSDFEQVCLHKPGAIQDFIKREYAFFTNLNNHTIL